MGGGRTASAVDMGRVVSAAGTAGQRGAPANLAARTHPRSRTSSAGTVAEISARRHRGLVKEDDERAARHKLSDRLVFDPVPSGEEAAEAVTSIRQMFAASGYAHEPPARQLCSADRSQMRVLDAFRLLQENPVVERCVVSLASDKAVWDAVGRNESVRELRASLFPGEGSGGFMTKEAEGMSFHDVSGKVLSLVFEHAIGKIQELAHKILKIVDELLSTALNGKETGRQRLLLDEALHSSFMLSILVSIVIVVARCNSALHVA